MSHLPTVSTQLESSVYLPPLSVKSNSQRVSLVPLFIDRVISPSQLKFSERLPLKTIQSEIELMLPPPKNKDVKPNWFEVSINPRPDQSPPSPDVVVSSCSDQSPSSSDIAVSPCPDRSSPSCNENEALESEDHKGWFQELKNYANINSELDNFGSIRSEVIDSKNKKNEPELQDNLTNTPSNYPLFNWTADEQYDSGHFIVLTQEPVSD